MIYFLALLPATALTVAGYFVWYLAERSEGHLRTFGRFLGFWAFTLAALVVLGAIFAAAHGGHRGFMRMHAGMHCPWDGGPRFGPRMDRRDDMRPPGPPEGGPGPPPPRAASESEPVNPPAPTGH